MRFELPLSGCHLWQPEERIVARRGEAFKARVSSGDGPLVVLFGHEGADEAHDGAGEEGVDPLVDLPARARDLASGDARAAHCLDQLVHRAGRDALDAGLLDDRHVASTTAAAWLASVRMSFGSRGMVHFPDIDAAGESRSTSHPERNRCIFVDLDTIPGDFARLRESHRISGERTAPGARHGVDGAVGWRPGD